MRKLETCFCFAAVILCLGIAAKSGIVPVVGTALLSAGMFAMAFRRPDATLRLLIFFIPFTGIFNQLLSLRGVPAMLAVLYAGLAGEKLARRSSESTFVYSLAMRVFIGGTIFSAGIALFRSLADTSFALPNAIGWIVLDLCIVLSGPLVYRLFREREVRAEDLYQAFLIPVLIAASQYFDVTRFGTVREFMMSGTPQYNGFFSDPNAQAISCALLIPVWFAFLMERPRSWPIWFWGLGLLFLLFVAGSRSALIAAAVGLAGISVYAGVRRPKIMLGVATLLLVCGILAIGAMRSSEKAGRYLRVGYIVDGVASVLTGGTPVVSLIHNRLVMWKGAVVIFEDKPVVGCGLGRYMIELPRHREEIEKVVNEKIVNDNAGNLYLHLMAEQGVVGIAIFLFLIGSLFVEFLQCRTKTPLQFGALAALAGIMVSFIFGAHTKNIEVNFFFWGILALLAAPRGINQHEHSK